MLYEFTREVAARMQKLPVEVCYGDQRFGRTVVLDNRITVKQQGPEAWDPPVVAPGGSKPVVWTRNVGVSAFFEVRSDQGGAGYVEHQRLCNGLLQEFMNACRLTAVRRGTPIAGQAASSPGFEPLEDGPDGWSGSTYLITFQIRIGVPESSNLVAVDASTLEALGSVGVTSGNQVQVACSPPEEP